MSKGCVFAKAMVLSAGYGLRLRPLTLDRPKALVEVGGMPLIDRVLDRLSTAGVETAVVNLHYKGTQLRRHLMVRKAPKIVFSDESATLLDTGGGVAKALPDLGPEAFYAVNSDIVWQDAARDSLVELAEFFDPAKMDALLLVHPTVSAIGYQGIGDFDMDPVGRLTRRQETWVAPFVFTGVQVLRPEIFQLCPEGPFSLNLLYDRAAEAGRLWGLRHEGQWMDVGTPAGFQAAQKALAEKRQ